jgi:hypothetical protein
MPERDLGEASRIRTADTEKMLNRMGTANGKGTANGANDRE